MAKTVHLLGDSSTDEIRLIINTPRLMGNLIFTFPLMRSSTFVVTKAINRKSTNCSAVMTRNGALTYSLVSNEAASPSS